MRLSDDKISHLSHIIYSGLREKRLIEPTGSESVIRKTIRQTIAKMLKMEDDIDTKVRLKLQSYSRKIPEGTSEWNVLYDKFLLEELDKKGMGLF